MANYTIELRDVVREHDIFPFTYPFYDENARLKFEEDFIKHFYFREIGSETIDRFIWNLEDKFNTVLPYYNELFKASQIEYSVLDNYKLVETTTINRENAERSGSVSSTVGKSIDEQETKVQGETTAERTGTNSGGSTQSYSETLNTTTAGISDTDTGATESSDTTETADKTLERATGSTQEGNETVSSSGSSEKISEGSVGSTKEEKRKFLDTPQGATDLDDSNYLTTLNQDSAHNVENTETTESGNTSENTTSERANHSISSEDSSETSETFNKANRHSVGSSSTSSETSEEGERNFSDSTISEDEFTTSEKSGSSSDTTHTGEQRTTQDNNTRSESSGTHKETQEIVRSGNIGVDADADMIQKHIKLQQILTKIKIMFFDECEDLFMGVY